MHAGHEMRETKKGEGKEGKKTAGTRDHRVIGLCSRHCASSASFRHNIHKKLF